MVMNKSLFMACSWGFFSFLLMRGVGSLVHNVGTVKDTMELASYGLAVLIVVIGLLLSIYMCWNCFPVISLSVELRTFFVCVGSMFSISVMVSLSVFCMSQMSCDHSCMIPWKFLNSFDCPDYIGYLALFLMGVSLLWGYHLNYLCGGKLSSLLIIFYMVVMVLGQVLIVVSMLYMGSEWVIVGWVMFPEGVSSAGCMLSMSGFLLMAHHLGWGG